MGGLPPGRKVFTDPGHFERIAFEFVIHLTMILLIGCPFSAMSIAGFMVSASDIVPNRSRVSAAPSSVPGTGALRKLSSSGMKPILSKYSRVASFGAGPMPLMA